MITHDMAKQDLATRMKGIAKASAPSMIPAPPPVRAKKDELPDTREFIVEPAKRLKLLRLVTRLAELSAEESAAKKAKVPIVLEVKQILGDYGISKAQTEGYRINYFNAPREHLDKFKLLAHNVSAQVIAECTVTKDAFTLKVTAPNEKEEEEAQ